MWLPNGKEQSHDGSAWKKKKERKWEQQKEGLENPGIDPGTSHMLSERSTIWASPPAYYEPLKNASEVFRLSIPGYK